ncbi:MAG: hypothetical protein JWO37_967, partial [Acidimicrobiales bacterium]|nr:hypothetical protein [Acidimicrobiales bacterium]
GAGGSGVGGPGGGAGGVNGGNGAGGTGATATGPLTASDKGVTATSIRMVFTYPDLGPVAQGIGLSGTSEDEKTSINAFVRDVNDRGGVLGRKIDPVIVSYNPLDEADMRSKCINWRNDPHLFAVIDINGGWHDDQQLCVTQEGKMPLLSPWTTVTDWVNRSGGYLWWVNADQVDTLLNLVAWAQAQSPPLLAKGVKFGVVAATREADSLALKYLTDGLSRAGLKPTHVQTIHFDTQSTAQANAEATVAVQQFKQDGDTVVLPLLPYNTMQTFLRAAQSQSFKPRLLLSDYEQGLTSALGMAETGGFKYNLQDQIGPTSVVLGNDDGPVGTHPYIPAAMDCYNTFKKYVDPAAYRALPNHSDWDGNLESTGTAMTTCEETRLFVKAATLAGPNLTRIGFNAAMGRITSFAGTVVPDLRYGPNRHAGPHMTRTVQVHVNDDGRCPLKPPPKRNVQGSCWLILRDFTEMQRA